MLSPGFLSTCTSKKRVQPQQKKGGVVWLVKELGGVVVLLFQNIFGGIILLGSYLCEIFHYFTRHQNHITHMSAQTIINLFLYYTTFSSHTAELLLW